MTIYNYVWITGCIWKGHRTLGAGTDNGRNCFGKRIQFKVWF